MKLNLWLGLTLFLGAVGTVCWSTFETAEPTRAASLKPDDVKNVGKTTPTTVAHSQPSATDSTVTASELQALRAELKSLRQEVQELRKQPPAASAALAPDSREHRIEQRAFAEVVAQEETAVFAERLSDEPEDESWSLDFEMKLQEHIMRWDRDTRIHHLDCRTTVCEARIELSSTAARDRMDYLMGDGRLEFDFIDVNLDSSDSLQGTLRLVRRASGKEFQQETLARAQAAEQG